MQVILQSRKCETPKCKNVFVARTKHKRFCTHCQTQKNRLNSRVYYEDHKVSRQRVDVTVMLEREPWSAT